MTSPGWQPATPSPGPSSPSPAGRPSRADGWDRRWLTVVVGLSVLALAAATTSAVLFLSAGASKASGSETAGGKGRNGGSDSSGQDKETPAISRPGELVPIDREAAHAARTPETESKGETSEERIAEHTFGLGESVLFTTGAAIRIDAIEPTSPWPGSEHDVKLKDPRVFAIHYTYTNFSDRPVEVRRIRSLDLQVEPSDLEVKWPEGKYPEVVMSNSAVLEDGISALTWPELETQVENVSLPAGESVQGVFVTYDVRKGPAKVRVEVGEYREEGHAWCVLDVPES